jgi:hypothetical protein
MFLRLIVYRYLIPTLQLLMEESKTERIKSLTCVRKKKLKNVEQNTKRPFFGEESLAENAVNCQHEAQNCPCARHESVVREWMYN